LRRKFVEEIVDLPAVNHTTGAGGIFPRLLKQGTISNRAIDFERENYSITR
jgi:hypothetical protein